MYKKLMYSASPSRLNPGPESSKSLPLVAKELIWYLSMDDLLFGLYPLRTEILLHGNLFAKYRPAKSKTADILTA